MTNPAKNVFLQSIGACSFALAKAGDSDRIEIQVTPAGRFKPNDGRKIPVDAWHIDSTIATRVIDRFNARKTPLVIDYEHQTLRKETNGQPAPAAAWFKSLQWREGQGLFATAELTARAKAAIDAKEYLYFSPVFLFDPSTGDVTEVLMGAFTNYPAIDGMKPLSLDAVAAASRLAPASSADLQLTEQEQAVCSAMGLSPEQYRAAASQDPQGSSDDVCPKLVDWHQRMTHHLSQQLAAKEK
ncbi:MAG: phage protease [Rubrivivax sp.]